MQSNNRLGPQLSDWEKSIDPDSLASNPRAASIYKLRAKGMTWAEIATVMGLSTPRVSQILKKASGNVPDKPYNADYAQQCQEYLERYGFEVIPPS